MTIVTTPPGWYVDPSRRHEYRYWDGASWTSEVADRGATAVDPPEPPRMTSVAPSLVPASALGPGFRALAAPRLRVGALRTALAAVTTAFFFELLASFVLLVTVSGSTAYNAPSQSTLEWSAWLYHAGYASTIYGYPPLALWLALFLVVFFLQGRWGALVPPVRALQQAGRSVQWWWGAPAERARLAQGLAAVGGAKTLVRARGRRGMLLAAEFSALAVTAISAYAVFGRAGAFLESGTSVAELSVGLGPYVCLIAGVVALISGIVAWPWTRERPVFVLADGSVWPEEQPVAGTPSPPTAQPWPTNLPSGPRYPGTR